MKGPFTFRQSRLGSNILIWSFVPTSIILFAVAFTIYYAYQRVTEDLVVGRNQQLTRLSARQLASDLDEYVSTLSTLTRSADLYSGNPDRQAALLKQSANSLLIFDAGVLVLDPNGRVALVEPHQPGLVGANWSDKAFFRQVMRSGGNSSEPAFSDILPGSPVNPEVIAVAVPILDNQQIFRGMLVGLFRLGASSYSAFYGGIVKLRLSETGGTYLVDSSGRVIYHADETQIGQNFRNQPEVQQVLKRQAGYLRTRDLNGQETLASYAPVPGTPWGLVDEEDWAGVLAASRGYGQFLLLLLVLGLILPTLVVTFGVQRITGPVLQLIAGAKEIAGGQYGQQIQVRTGDEIEELVTQFNRMSEQLRKSYAELENRVAARTQELATLNAIAAVASRSLHLNEIMQDALDETLKALEMKQGSAYHLEPDGVHLHLVAQQGLSPGFVQANAERKYSGSVIELSATAGRVQAWLAADYPEAALKPWLAQADVLQVICVPLLVKGKLVGAFLLGSDRRQEITPEVQNLLSAIGQQIGVAVENAQLYQQAEESATLAERARLARELHDSVTQSLYSVTLFAEAAASLMAAGEYTTATEHLRDLRDTAQEALREMRLLIFELRPLALEQNGLSAALQERLEAVEARGGVKSELHVTGEERLLMSVQKELYQIAQEVLNNVLKHAHASRVTVDLQFADDSVCLEIIDDGIGFSPARVRPGGMGLEGMRARAQQLGGSIQLESMPGKGTKVIVQAPLTPPAASREDLDQGKGERKVERDGE